jgi:hypothetical protein
VIGVHDRGSLRIGDTLSADGDLQFTGIPRFSPEHFARVQVTDPLRRKHLDTGLRHLSEEGAAQVFYTDPCRPRADRRRGRHAPVRRAAASPRARVRRAEVGRSDRPASLKTPCRALFVRTAHPLSAC